MGVDAVVARRSDPRQDHRDRLDHAGGQCGHEISPYAYLKSIRQPTGLAQAALSNLGCYAVNVAHRASVAPGGPADRPPLLSRADWKVIRELKDVPLGRFQHTENRLDFRRGVQLGRAFSPDQRQAAFNVIFGLFSGLEAAQLQADLAKLPDSVMDDLAAIVRQLGTVN